jgi:hypothetical protein
MRSRLPDARALTWLELNLEKLGLATTLVRVVEPLGLATLAWATEPAAQPAPVIAATPSAVALSNEAALRGVRDILLPSIPASLGSLDVTEPYFRVVAPVPPLDRCSTVPRLHQGRIRGG